MTHVLWNGLVPLADLAVDNDTLKIVAGSILATAVVVAIIVFREKNTKLRLVFGLIALALVGWSIYLFSSAEIKKTQVEAEQAPQVADCKRALGEAAAIARTKLVTVETEAEAKAVAQAIIDVIENSPCKP